MFDRTWNENYFRNVFFSLFSTIFALASIIFSFPLVSTFFQIQFRTTFRLRSHIANDPIGTAIRRRILLFCFSFLLNICMGLIGITKNHKPFLYKSIHSPHYMSTNYIRQNTRHLRNMSHHPLHKL